MKWKTVLVKAFIVLLIAALALLLVKGIEFQIVQSLESKQATREIKDRIKQYELVLEEQQLITEILTLKYEATLIQAKFQSAPPPTRTVIESENK